MTKPNPNVSGDAAILEQLRKAHQHLVGASWLYSRGSTATTIDVDVIDRMAREVHRIANDLDVDIQTEMTVPKGCDVVILGGKPHNSDALVEAMDDGLREELHGAHGSNQEFHEAYQQQHVARFGEAWPPEAY